MAGFIQAGVVDPRKLAEHVLKNGFGVKNPEQFLTAPPQAAPAGLGAGPMPAEGMPSETMGGMPPEGGLPPELAEAQAMLGGMGM